MLTGIPTPENYPHPRALHISTVALKWQRITLQQVKDAAETELAIDDQGMYHIAQDCAPEAGGDAGEECFMAYSERELTEVLGLK